MTAQVLSFLRRSAPQRDWSAQELAEFYRVEAALIQASLRVTAARGLSDEGEPWFVFCRAEDDDVIIHFARIDGRYVISAPAYCGNASGSDFRALVRSVVERQPVVQSRPTGGNLFLHPAALLVMLVAAALLKSGPADATPARAVADAIDGKARRVAPAGTPTPAANESTAPEAQHERQILTAIAAAIAPLVLVQAEPITIIVSASDHRAGFVDHPHEQPINPMLLDLSRDGAAHGAGATTSALPLPQPIAVLPVEATPFTLIPMIHQQDAATALIVSSAALPTVQTALLLDSPSIPTDLSAFIAGPNPANGAQYLPLSNLPDIPQADQDLLHTLGVSANVAYTATLPVAVATVLRTGIHTSVTRPAADEHASSADNATTPPLAVAPVHSASGPEAEAPAATTAATPVTVATPVAPTTAATPDLSAVLVTVEQFQAVAIHPVVVISDHSAIFYDAAAVTQNFNAVASVTYDFNDGFSISLIGLPAELAHAGVHV